MEVLQFAPTVVEIDHRNLEAGRDIAFVQVWANEVSVTCLPRLEPPLFSVPFALAAFRFRSAQCLVHETPLTPPAPPRVAGFFMSTRFGISCYMPGKSRNVGV
jgi:hypothetical protein